MRVFILSLVAIFVSPFSLWAQQEFDFMLKDTDDKLVIRHLGKDILTYHKAEVPPPEGVDPIFKRSAFIHPIKSPKGGILTGIHPADHYHHLGLWNAWVKCKVAGQEVDFWNLKKGLGRVKFDRMTGTVMSSNQAAGFAVIQNHVAYLGEEKKETVILEEALEIKAALVDGAYEIDFQSTQKNVSEYDLELPQYRYGGPIAYRAPHSWTVSNSDYLSSEGKTRVDGHTTRSKWCAMWGADKTTGGDVCLTILVHQENHDFPQRMRVWPPNSNNGAIFFNYVPIQETGWAIKKGETSKMRYRLVVQDGKPDKATLDKRWERFNTK